MTQNINLFNSNDDKRKGLERTGRVGGNARNSVNQYELDENSVMIPKSVSGQGSLSIKLDLD